MSWLHLERGITLSQTQAGEIRLGPITLNEAVAAKFVLFRRPREERNTFELLTKMEPISIDEMPIIHAIVEALPGATLRPDIEGTHILFVPDLEALGRFVKTL